jgi:hypothetical protein
MIRSTSINNNLAIDYLRTICCRWITQVDREYVFEINDRIHVKQSDFGGRSYIPLYVLQPALTKQLITFY